VTTLVPDFCAAAGRHDVDAMLDTLAPGATLTSPLVGGAVFSGSADLKLLLGAVYGALRDLRWDEPIGVGRRRLVISVGRIGRVEIIDALVVDLDETGRITGLFPHLRPWVGATVLAARLAPTLVRHPAMLRRAQRRAG